MRTSVTSDTALPVPKKTRLYRIGRDLRMNKYLYIMIIPVMAYYLIFEYGPMYGVIIAFKNFSPMKGVLGSDWVGLKYFQDFFTSMYAWRTIKNTFLISLYGLLFSFPAPIILALLLNEVKNKLFKRTVQTISYMPHFISLIVVCGLVVDFTQKNGLINDILHFFTGERILFLQKPEWYRTIHIASGVWQQVGWSSILYLAALAGIDMEQYEAANIDGANRWQQMLHITLPGITPTIVILFILNIGQMMNVGYEKVLLLYNPLTYSTADVISTYVYRAGLQSFNYGYSTAVGLFNSLINLTLIISANYLSRKVNDTSLW